VRTKPVVLRERARQDVDDAIAHYLAAGGETAALGFVDALERALAHLGRHPASGSLRYAHELHLPWLRFWPLRRHPHLVFYVEHDQHVDVWRVLHGGRDIPAWLQGAGSAE
jgi:toxin ParE1/3/4